MIVFVLAGFVAVSAALLVILINVIKARIRSSPGAPQADGTLDRTFRWRTAGRSAGTAGVVTAVIWIWLNSTGFPSLVYEAALNVHWPLALPAALALRRADVAQPVIVLLGGGTAHSGPNGTLRPYGDSIEKIALTAVLYHRAVLAGHAPIVVVSGGDPQHHGMAEADNYAEDLRDLGVPDGRVLRENRSLTTYQNAANVAALLGDTTQRPVILVTTALHMHRALLDFRRFDMAPFPVALPPPALHFSLLPSLRALYRADGDLHELVGIAQFHVYRSVHLF